MSFRSIRMRSPVLMASIPMLFALLLAVPVWGFDEGIDYQRLPQPQPTETGDKVEVLEIFWYGCPHCWHLEPLLARWLESLPVGAEFRRMPAPGGRWDAHARAFFAARSMGELETFHRGLFEAIHERHRRIMSEDDLVAFAAEIGLDADAFRARYESEAVETELRHAREMAARYGLQSVPTLIVDGRYRVTPGESGGTEPMLEILDTLIARELADGS
ncbi:thiol:disulfide interchange protein DsbA/DsbL [Imhoffiella purpurea]|uniref:Thiol:disulfide interchange protein n=1 Tax=Imhoffiella purpurea TaxID=1249627 RepID=W9V8F6_9GAMM|nr:thiol:disulfide interchange protein DsbA/DsbL [Imhoffiella purpurea]EXJ15858.1 Periplasmic thiol:disulfide interchange protein DsbA [Imhoffiella purpurea]